MKGEMADWKAFLLEGQGYHRTAQGSVRRPEVFTPAIIHNLAGMSIEKYFMAMFMHRGIMPRNHTMRDLLEEAKPLFEIDDVLEKTLLYMDSLQEICSLEAYSITPPKPEDVPDFLAAVQSVARLAEKETGVGIVLK
jgi:hypothetical protein